MIDIFLGLSAESWAEIIRNYVITFVSLLTLWVAWSGLHNWKSQENWKEDRILAKSILLNFYKATQAISDFRRPFMSAVEMANASEDEDYDWRDNKKKNAAKQNAYIKRYKVIMDVFEELHPLGVEAQVVWGAEILDFVRELRGLVIKMKFALEDSPSFYDKNHELEKDRRDEVREIMFDYGDNEFSKNIEDIINRVNLYISPYLGRRS